MPAVEDIAAAEAALALILPVSRETIERLAVFVALLRRWQASTNLVGPATLAEVWERHVADSAQLVPLAPEARVWLDLGSGAGFPGLVVALLLADRPRTKVHLVDTDRRKGAFLRAAIRETGAPAAVIEARFETVAAEWEGPIDVVTSRAATDFLGLCLAVEPLLARGAAGLFHKGAHFAAERDAAAEHFRFDLVEHQSRIGPGAIVELRRLARRDGRER